MAAKDLQHFQPCFLIKFNDSCGIVLKIKSKNMRKYVILSKCVNKCLKFVFHKLIIKNVNFQHIFDEKKQFVMTFLHK